jgi:uridylate kinase
MIKTLSLGGSLVAPSGIDVAFLQEFRQIVQKYLAADAQRKLIIVIGGGSPARTYQQALKELNPSASHDALDWVGIAATKLNAQLVATMLSDWVSEPVVQNPELDDFASGRILVGAGWKPGFSSDYDAAVLAHRFGSKQLINLSNISYVYSADPKKDTNAVALTQMSWAELTALVGEVWTPGANLPFDPIAAKFAHAHQLEVIVANGKNLSNLDAILNDLPFEGTTIR